MDSDEFQPFSQSNITDSPDTIQSLNSIGFRSQTPTNGMISSRFQYQPTFPPFSSQSQQQYSQNFSYQGLLSAPNWINMTPYTEPSKPSRKKNKSTLNHDKNPTTVRRWTLDEDIALTKARLHVSCDADTGVGQNFETLWSRILQVWRENMGEFDRTRDSNALECRWSRLQTAINKFHGCYEWLERMKKSGTNLDDVIGSSHCIAVHTDWLKLDLDSLLHTQLEASSSMQVLHTQFGKMHRARFSSHRAECRMRVVVEYFEQQLNVVKQMLFGVLFSSLKTV